MASSKEWSGFIAFSDNPIHSMLLGKAMPESHHVASNSFWEILLMLVNQWTKTTLLHDAHAIAKANWFLSRGHENKPVEYLNSVFSRVSSAPNIPTYEQLMKKTIYLHLLLNSLRPIQIHLIHLFNQILPTNSHPTDFRHVNYCNLLTPPEHWTGSGGRWEPWADLPGRAMATGTGPLAISSFFFMT